MQVTDQDQVAEEDSEEDETEVGKNPNRFFCSFFYQNN